VRETATEERSVEEILCVARTTVSDLGHITILKMTAVRNLTNLLLELRDAEVVMTEVRGVVLLKTHATRAKETVMGQMMEDPMRCAKESLCVATTTVRNLVLFIMREMTAARSHPHLRAGKAGYPGVGAAETAEEGEGKDIDVVPVVSLSVAIQHSPRSVLAI